MPLLSRSEAGIFRMLVRKRQDVIEQMLAAKLPLDCRCDHGVATLLHELVLINEAPVQTDAGRHRARRQFRLGLGELLDRCDLRAVTDPEVALSHAVNYMAFGCVARARRLLENTLSRFETSHDVRRELARVLSASRENKRALIHLELLCADRPNDPSLHREAVSVAIQCLSIEKAIAHLQHLIRLCPEDLTVEQDIAVIEEVRQARRAGLMPGSVPGILLEGGAGVSDAIRALRLVLAEQLYRQHGTLLIHNARAPELIRWQQNQTLMK